MAIRLEVIGNLKKTSLTRKVRGKMQHIVVLKSKIKGGALKKRAFFFSLSFFWKLGCEKHSVRTVEK